MGWNNQDHPIHQAVFSNSFKRGWSRVNAALLRREQGGDAAHDLIRVGLQGFITILRLSSGEAAG